MSDELDADDRALIAKIKALPDEHAEPDWTAMARNIRLAVADEKPRRRWWLFALPALAVGGAAAILALTLHRDEPVSPVAVRHAPPVTVEEHPEPSAAVYLDGDAVDIDAVDPSALDEDLGPPDIASDDDNLLPTDHWIDRLDDRALDHVEKILDKKKS